MITVTLHGTNNMKLL